MAYRAIHDTIFGDFDFHTLSPEGKLVFFHLKLALGATGIGVMGVGKISDETGLEYREAQIGVDGLQKIGWLKVEGTVMWLVRGLEHDPHQSIRSPKTRTMLNRMVSGLPSCSLVQQWREKYGVSDGASDGASDGVSDAPSVRHGASDGASDGAPDGAPDALETRRLEEATEVTPEEYLTPGEPEGGNPERREAHPEPESEMREYGVPVFDRRPSDGAVGVNLRAFLEQQADQAVAAGALLPKERAKAIRQCLQIAARFAGPDGRFDLSDTSAYFRVLQPIGVMPVEMA